jgi:hypothetical protein
MNAKQIIEKLQSLKKYSAEMDCSTICFEEDKHWGGWIKVLDIEELIEELQKEKNEIALVTIDSEILELCIEMYKTGEKLEAIKWLIEEANDFGIKAAKEFFDSLELL